MPWEVHGRGSHKQSSNTDLATWAQASTQAWSSITGCFLSSPYLGLQPTLWPSEIKAPRLASALAPCPDFPVCLEDRALGKKWGLYKVGHPTHRWENWSPEKLPKETEPYQWQRATPRAWPTALLPPPQTLYTGCSGLQGREEEEPSKGTGRDAGT